MRRLFGADPGEIYHLCKKELAACKAQLVKVKNELKVTTKLIDGKSAENIEITENLSAVEKLLNNRINSLVESIVEKDREIEELKKEVDREIEEKKGFITAIEQMSPKNNSEESASEHRFSIAESLSKVEDKKINTFVESPTTPKMDFIFNSPRSKAHKLVVAANTIKNYNNKQKLEPSLNPSEGGKPIVTKIISKNNKLANITTYDQFPNNIIFK